MGMLAWEQAGLGGPRSVPGRDRKGLLLPPLGWRRGWERAVTCLLNP